MAIRKNKKFIDPRYFMDEKAGVIKEEKEEKSPGSFPVRWQGGTRPPPSR